MTRFYEVSVPIKLKINLTYKSHIPLKEGIRVIVSVGRNLYTGIVIKQVNPLQSPPRSVSGEGRGGQKEELRTPNSIKYKHILEIIDDEPVMSKEMLKLATWMADYYKTALGIVIDTMLPLALKHHITQKVRVRSSEFGIRSSELDLPPPSPPTHTSWREHIEAHNTLKVILDFLKDKDDWVEISLLRESIKAQDFYHAIETLEREQIIEVYRTYDEKIKPKYVNYIQISNHKLQITNTLLSLTPKQQFALEIIKNKLVAKISDLPANEVINAELPLTEIANDVSYSILKSLEKKGIINIYPKKVDIDLFNFPETQAPREIILNDEQKEAIFQITNVELQDTSYKLKENKSNIQTPLCSRLCALCDFSVCSVLKKNSELRTPNSEPPKTFLLYGITGSGKTEVYIEAIKHFQKLGKSALMLVPEISLTPQTVFRFFHTFGNEIAVLHSSLTDRERYMQWKMIAQGKIKIVIGARSAIFAPLKNLGVIIVDEEHESSYKQDHQPCYNGRDIAVMRGEIEKSVVILGSATPSLESWNNVLNRKYKLLSLTTRPGNAILPTVKIIDLRQNTNHISKDNIPPLVSTETSSGTTLEGASSDSQLTTTDIGLFSQELKAKIQDRLEKKEQIILFHNRRGYANFIQCINCGKLIRCPDCDISMNFHKRDNVILCHYCGYSEEVPRKCPDCGNYRFIYGAPGTEQIDSQLKILFPSAKILRMDSDTTRKKNSFNEMFEAMKNQHIDILVGTQMISKGLDFHNVTLVGVILADVTLNIPDFRSTEKTFQLLTQVAGRSGRGEKKGEVIIQSRNPDHYALVYAAKQDFLNFAKKELSLRSEVFYPPIYRIARILFSCPDLAFLKETLIKNKLLLIKIKNEFPKNDFHLLPFIEAPLPKIKNKYRYHFIIKATKSKYIQNFLDMFLNEFECPNKIDMLVDVDPLSLM